MSDTEARLSALETKVDLLRAAVALLIDAQEKSNERVRNMQVVVSHLIDKEEAAR